MSGNTAPSRRHSRRQPFVPEFEVFDKDAFSSAHTPTITILKARVLSLNYAAFVALEQPAAVELLFDKVKRIIGLRVVPPNVRHACFVRRAGRSRHGPFLVSAMAFLDHYEVDAHESRRWRAWLEDETLCISLDDESERVTSNRAVPRDDHA